MAQTLTSPMKKHQRMTATELAGEKSEAERRIFWMEQRIAESVAKGDVQLERRDRSGIGRERKLIASVELEQAARSGR